MFTKTFRNTLVVSSLLIGASLLAGTDAMADSDSGAVSGDVQAVNAITFTPATGATTHITGGVANPTYPIGTLAVQNNAAAGWTLDVQSASGGKLVNTVTSSDVITYTAVTTGDIGASHATSRTLAVAATDYELHNSAFDAAVAAGVSNVAVTAAIASGQFVPVGTYEDTLTFTLTDK